ncbi:GFA family protein [Labrys neptuniae]
MQNQAIRAIGSCRCGQVEFEVTAAPLMTMACHCRGCQKLTGSAFSLNAAIPAEGFRVTSGEPVIGGLHGPSRHYFCPHCKSWLFTRPEGLDFFVNIRPTMLAEGLWTESFIETCTAEKLPWATTSARHSYAEYPAAELYQPLMAEFAAHMASQAGGGEPGAEG